VNASLFPDDYRNCIFDTDVSKWVGEEHVLA
jgi:hypothetical protein